MFAAKNQSLLPSGRHLQRLAWLLAAVWTLFMAAALVLRARDVRDETHQAALAIARAHFENDQVFRLWAVQRGGVYVPVDEHNQPNPRLGHVPDRDVTAADGRQLTLVDPVTLARQLATEHQDLYGIVGHLASLEPTHPDNAPDTWERNALMEFAGGTAEVAEFTEIDGKPNLRLMRPMVTRDECLKCHAEQAGHVGSVRGGVGISVPLEPLYAAERRGNLRALWMLGPVWVIGLVGIAVSSRVIRLQVARRRQVVAELQSAHDLLRLESEIYRDGPVVVFQCRDEPGWPVVQISTNVEQVLGFEPSAFRDGSLTLARMVHEDDQDRLRAAVAATAGEQDSQAAHTTCRFRHRDGSDIWALVHPVAHERAAGGGATISGYLLDITALRRVEADLRESEERLDLALTGAELGAWDWDLTTDAVVFDARWAAMLGHEISEIPGNLAAWVERVHPDDMPGTNAVLKEHLEGRTPIYRAEFRMRHASGGWVWILDTGKVLVRDDDGRPLRAVGVHQDITARRTAEAAREMALERFRTLIGSLQAGVLVETAERTIVQANQAFCSMFGIASPDNLTGADCARVVVDTAALFADPEAFTARQRELLDGGEVFVSEELHLKDGRVLERDFVPILLQDRFSGNMWIYRDITRRKRLEKEAVQQERLAAVGQLAAGIAHDFNNILCSIMGYTELLQSSPETPVSSLENLRRISDSSRRAAHLVRQILDFSQKTMRRVQPVDLDLCVRDTVGFLRAMLPENIHMDLQVEPGSYLMEAEPAQLQQLITNLAINARDAMPGGGVLKLSLRHDTLDTNAGKCAHCGQTLAGPWLRLDVADTGTGIPAEAMPLIFEPFFTTKAIGEGTGLGLSQAAGIAAQHGGHFQVHSEVGNGTTFTLLLPHSAAVRATPLAETPAIVRGAGQSVLVVEDDPSVSEAITAMLRHLGYRVTAAGSGRLALDLFGREEGRFDLVLTDVVMPELDGEALCRHLRELAPSVPVVAMSGYPLGARGVGLLDLGAAAWVQKPITIEQLAAVVAGALGGRTRG